MGQIVLDYPSHIRIEITQGCNRSCYSCPASPRKSDWRFMNTSTFEAVINRLDERVKRMEFSMHGEPLLNPNIVDYIFQTRRRLPKTQISIITNTEHFQKEPNLLIELFKAGLNFIHGDTYTEKSKKHFIELIHRKKSELDKLNIGASYFVKGGLNIWSKHSPTMRHILLSDESEGFNVVGKHIIRNIHTFGGNLPYDRWEYFGLKLDDFPMMKKCTEPMKCAPIDIYGNVVMCCADSYKSVLCGNLMQHTMYNIWNSPILNYARCALSQGWRDIIPACYFCNRPSFRVGLWPYKGMTHNRQFLKTYFWNTSDVSDNVLDLFRRKNESST